MSIDVLEEGWKDAVVPGFTRTGSSGARSRIQGWSRSQEPEPADQQPGAGSREPEPEPAAGAKRPRPARPQSTNTPSSRRTQPDAAIAPPSTCSVVPLTNPDMSPARYTIGAAQSSGVPQPSGTLLP